jgi:N-dimethylarginine dimethylaminohydrolase
VSADRPPIVTGPDEVPEGGVADLPGEPVPRRGRVLMAEPTHFEVTRHDNPHTVDASGALHTVDGARAREQWAALRDAYAELGLEVVTYEGPSEAPDLVFCANTAWPYRDPATGDPRFVPGRMRYEGREPEVEPMRRTLEDLGYAGSPLPEGLGPFEAGGDLLWWEDRGIVLAGAGERTTRKAWPLVQAKADVPFVGLDLPDPAFYHLDTCVTVLDADHVAYVPEALADEGRALLEALVPEPVPLDAGEAREGLAGNAHCPDGEHVLLDEANTNTVEQLGERGFTPVPVDTSEFRKAGGSVFCMQNAVW